jgi:pepF/M3 family oligoendopeptidase
VANQYSQTWDLESIFAGGAKSPALLNHLSELDARLEALQQQVADLPEPTGPAGLDRWHAFIAAVDTVIDEINEGAAFLSCLTAQNVADMEAKLLMGRLYQMGAVWGQLEIILKDRIAQLSEETWQNLLADPRFAPVAFNMQELRDRAADLMPKNLETLANDLAVDGYHAWGQLYSTIVGKVKVPVAKDGKVEQLSVGQAYNKFSDPDPAFRAQLFAKWEEAFADQAEVLAATLNHLSGYRLNLYRHRGWDSIMKEPLQDNRMTEATLNAMWSAVDAGKAPLLAYFKRKAKLMGTGAYHWYDEHAPLGSSTTKLSYDEAAAFIVANFRQVSPKLADFAQRAFDQSWIESEDRAGKMPGGFCTPFPQSRQCRIFLTFGGDTNSTRTIAHELGHAFHFDVMWDIPPMARMYAMNVAETASTFAELITARAAVKAAPTREEKLALLDASVKETVAMFMNIHSRFVFETRFYEARKKGLVSVEQLNSLMEQAQRDAFKGGLASYHKLFWASKGHFYMTGAPFYNYPYVFGYLFSHGIYAMVAKEGAAFEQRYIDLLRDTGRMTVEDLAARHLGVDLTKPAFWEQAVDAALEDVREFLALTE